MVIMVILMASMMIIAFAFRLHMVFEGFSDMLAVRVIIVVQQATFFLVAMTMVCCSRLAMAMIMMVPMAIVTVNRVVAHWVAKVSVIRMNDCLLEYTSRCDDQQAAHNGMLREKSDTSSPHPLLH